MECDSQPKGVGSPHVGSWTRLIEGWFVGTFQHVL